MSNMEMGLIGSEKSTLQRFSDVMVQNELLAKENRCTNWFGTGKHIFEPFEACTVSFSIYRLMDSYLYRKAGPDVNWEELQRDVLRAQGKHARKDFNINQQQKYSIALAEHEFRTKQLKALEDKAAEDISLLQAIIEGIKIRINEMRKETYEFKRDIVIGGENQRTGSIMAEKVVRYSEEKLKQKVSGLNVAYKYWQLLPYQP